MHRFAIPALVLGLGALAGLGLAIAWVSRGVDD